MKITNIEMTMIAVPMKRPAQWATGGLSTVGELFVTVETDEGITGLGVTYNHPETAAIIRTRLLPVLIGKDPSDTEGLWQAMYHATHTLSQQGLIFNAISAIDIALWDIKAKSFDLPLFKLLGQHGDRVPVYGSGGFLNLTIDELIEDNTAHVANGIKAVKMKIGLDNGKNVREDIRRVAAVREAVGDDIDIFVDANGSYTPRQAIAASEQLAELGVGWYEEPVHSSDRHGLARVAERSAVPVATGEFEHHIFAFRSLLTENAVDIVQADIGRVGGVTGWMKIAHLAEAFNAPVAPHAFDLLHSQVMCAIPNGMIIEYLDIYTDLPYTQAPSIIDGHIVPDASRPGHGLELDPERIAKYRVEL